MDTGEFSVAGTRQYSQVSPLRWVIAHIVRYKAYLTSFVVGTILYNVLTSAISLVIGNSFSAVVHARQQETILITSALVILGIVLGRGVIGLLATYAIELIAEHIERDARDELYRSLLSKSQTFHNRQRVGNIMALATNDIRQLNLLVNPGVDLIFDALMNLLVPLVFIGFIRIDLLLVPLLFVVAFVLALLLFSRQIGLTFMHMRAQFGAMNATLTETIHGIEIVQAGAQEDQEFAKFEEHARRYRNLFVHNGKVQGLYLPPLLLSLTLVGSLLHGLLLFTHGGLSLGSLVAFLSLILMLQYSISISMTSFAMIALGLASAGRVLKLMKEETEIDENLEGYAAPVQGDLAFEHVTFSYGDVPVLKDISFRAARGQTLAIVGQTGEGKTTLTKLVNRTYDATKGRILIDGVDIRQWNLARLRSQVATIEQDVFLFSKSIAQNITFGLSGQVDRGTIENGAREAQAHEFIMSFKDGYETVLGERGVTLSGGQRQRIAIARALLTDPRILILDDATSAVDSATEDAIQQAIRRVQQGRTTLLITNRLAQIRRADKVLLLYHGELLDQGTHTELLARSSLYRRIFAHGEEGAAMQSASSPEVQHV